MGSLDYGGKIIYTSTGANPRNHWGLSFGNGAYVHIYTGNVFAYVGTMAVRAVPEASSAICGTPRVEWLLQLPNSHPL